MARFQTMKRSLRDKLLESAPQWRAQWFCAPGDEMQAVAPLISFLPSGGLLAWRAVLALGLLVSALAGQDPGGEGAAKARTVMRRLMWQMNEDSGNTGWGICEAMGEICAQNPMLAREYGRIALSYTRDTGKADNYLEHAPLRRGAYWTVGRLGSAFEPLRAMAWPLLAQGLADEDIPSRGIAAWGLGRMAASAVPGEQPQRLAALAALDALPALLDESTPCLLLDGITVREESVGGLAREGLDRLREAAPV